MPVVKSLPRSFVRRSWSGFWFVNVDNDPDWRNWDDCMKYGFIAAGWGQVFTKPLCKLVIGSKIFAYMKTRGCVGYGEVVIEACPVKQFKPIGFKKYLLELPLEASEMNHSSNDPDQYQCEWVVGIDWHKTFSREQAKRFTGIFAARNIVCKLRDQQTLRFLRRAFKVSD